MRLFSTGGILPSNGSAGNGAHGEGGCVGHLGRDARRGQPIQQNLQKSYDSLRQCLIYILPCPGAPSLSGCHHHEIQGDPCHQTPCH